jgi:deoxycytidylate deaminase
MNTTGCQKDLALFVVLYPCALIVLSPVQLDIELVFMAVEVEDIRTNRVLTTELQTTELTTT